MFLHLPLGGQVTAETHNLCGLTTTPRVALDGTETSPILGPPTDLLVVQITDLKRSHRLSGSPSFVISLECKSIQGWQRSSAVLWKHPVCVTAPVSFQDKELGASFAALADLLIHVFKIH